MLLVDDMFLVIEFKSHQRLFACFWSAWKRNGIIGKLRVLGYRVSSSLTSTRSLVFWPAWKKHFITNKLPVPGYRVQVSPALIRLFSGPREKHTLLLVNYLFLVTEFKSHQHSFACFLGRVGSVYVRSVGWLCVPSDDCPSSWGPPGRQTHGAPTGDRTPVP